MKAKETGLTPVSLLRTMSRELDRVLEEPWTFFRGRSLTEPSAWAPEMDVFEKDGRLMARVDLPGMKKEDINVEVSEGRLLISGERKREMEEKKDNWYRCEREFGSFFRAIPLPEGVTFEHIKATFSDGVLEVSLPLIAKALPPTQKVPIEEVAAGAKKTAA